MWQVESAGVPAPTPVTPAASTPGTTWKARKSSSARPANGVRTASRIVTVPWVGVPRRRPRSSVGVAA